MSLVEIKDVNALIDNKPSFDLPVRKKTIRIWKTSRNDVYPTGNLSDIIKSLALIYQYK